MERKIRKVAILGSGTMGSGLASHLANAGISSIMLDIPPSELTTQEKELGLSLDNPAVRNRIVNQNKMAGVVKMKPAGIMKKDFEQRVATGNFEDNLDLLADCDWIVEAVSEKLDIKKQILEKIGPFVVPGTIVTSNTSGISINRIAEDMPKEFRKYWMGTHFFNPVRYMKLIEMIPGKDTLPEIFDFMKTFCEKTLGKTAVVCKDTPCFIANRIGTAIGTNVMNLTVKYGLTFSEVDALTGFCVGRPRTATYMLFDLVGLDIAATSAKTVSNNINDPEEKKLLSYPKYIDEMLQDNRLGNKTKQGFYQKQGNDKLMFDFENKSYIPQKAASFPSLTKAQAQKTLSGKLEELFNGDDTASRFVWEHMKHYFIHSSSLIPEISDNILNIDNAMVLGYNHQAGPFQLWTGLDLGKYVARMEAEGEKIPVWVKDMLKAGVEAFYTEINGRDYYYSILDKKYLQIEPPAGAIIIKDVKASGKTVWQVEDAALYDIGDGVVCLDIQSKNAALSDALMQAMVKASDELDRNWAGMVITSASKNFCVGADLKSALAYIKAGEFNIIEKKVELTQDITLRNKYSEKPIVAAPFGMALGGGCEVMMQCSGVQAAGETYCGLVEMGVGLIPGGGGMKEVTMRALERTEGTSALQTEFLLAALEKVAAAKVSSSAYDAIDMGYMRKGDGISLGREYQLADAKNKVLGMIAAGYHPPEMKPFPCPGINDNALLLMGGKSMVDSGYMSEYDYFIFQQLVYVMTGGGVSKNEMITEKYLLKLEREAFVLLCKEAKTQERIAHMLSTGKALRN